MNDKTLHLRQVHPNLIQEDGNPSRVAFTPTPDDKGELSVYDGDQISAVESYTHYTEISNLQSIGVWAVTGQEVSSLGLASKPKPLPDFDEHAVIDFNPRTPKEFRNLAKELRKKAIERGCLHTPEDK